MYCSNCGADTQSEKTYCKRCGAWIPSTKSLASLEFGGATPQHNIFSNIFLSVLSAVAALFSAIALYSGAQWSVSLAVSFCLSIAVWQASNVIVSLKLRRRFKGEHEGMRGLPEPGADGKVAAVDAARTGPLLSTQSVTENTTELLVLARRVAEQDEKGKR